MPCGARIAREELQVSGGVSVVPEPASLALFTPALLGSASSRDASARQAERKRCRHSLGTGGVWLGDATQADMAVGWREHHDIVGLNAPKLFEGGARRISQTGAALPHLEALPQHEGKKADKDV